MKEPWIPVASGSPAPLCPRATKGGPPRAAQTPAPDPASPLEGGLSDAQAAQRLIEDGPNALPGGRRRSLLSIALATVREPMFLLLLGAATLYLLLGEPQEGATLLGFVAVTLGLTLYQEGKTERAIEALRDLTSPRALVIRGGRAQRIAGREVVRGDLLKLSEGDRVPADALLLTADGVRVDESLLTGESVPVGKRSAQPDEQAAAEASARGAPGGDENPAVYAGTLIVQGNALARVMATGARSEIGRIGASLSHWLDERSPLQKQTDRLVRQLAWIALALSLTLVLSQGLMKGEWLPSLLSGIALAMALLPEEYPVVLTLFPALGARRLSQQGVLTRRINAIETLGAITVLCSDKTGTLTENRMTVTQLVGGGVGLTDSLSLDARTQGPLPEALHLLVELAILASVVDPFDPMEKAFHELGRRFLAGTEHLHHDWQLVQAYALSPTLRAMSNVWAAPGEAGCTVAAKGAPEAVMDLCHLDAAQQSRVVSAVEAMAASGLRVLAVARASMTGHAWPADAHGFDFDFIGLIGLADPVRAEVPSAVAECHAAGIRVVMITGDYPATAKAVAQQAGIAGRAAHVLTGTEIEALDDAQLRERMAGVTLCARIAPAQKLRIVQALKDRGEIVAMTGDGVNDAPALRAAHVGVAMGRRGTDVARESASLVLIDDNFAAIVAAIRLGRRIFDNLRQAMSYILAVHVPIAGMAMLPVLWGWPALLSPMHIALLELIIDPACSIAFENEPAQGQVMRRPPRDAAAPLFGGATLGWSLVQGLGVLAVVLAAFAWASPRMDEPQARAFAFATLVVGNLALILANRSATRSLWATLHTPNALLWAVMGLATALLLIALYQPWVAGVLRFAPLPLMELALACGLGMLSVFWFEGVKRLRQGAR